MWAATLPNYGAYDDDIADDCRWRRHGQIHRRGVLTSDACAGVEVDRAATTEPFAGHTACSVERDEAGVDSREEDACLAGFIGRT
jgi:hypothetical protein